LNEIKKLGAVTCYCRVQVISTGARWFARVENHGAKRKMAQNFF